MTRRTIAIVCVCLAAAALIGCGSRAAEESAVSTSDQKPAWAVAKTEAEWRAQLTDLQYEVCRLKGTERAFTGAYWDTKTPGVYACIGCDQPLYDSEAKYDSGTGWPSFWQAVDADAIATAVDRGFFYTATELLCSRCGSHLGHVFDDGPEPTGQRHCINSASLKLIPREAPPAPRD